METRGTGWDWWSEVKLQILREYLQGFTTAVRGKSAEALCLDLFAGNLDNQRRHGGGSFPGSARIALEAVPPFTRLALFELPDPAATLERDIRRARPDDTRWKVFPGDCNVTLSDALDWLAPVQWAPTFAFLDPRGLQVQWTTLEVLAGWRAGRKTKVELWMLFPEPALARVLGLRGARGRRSAEKLDRLYGGRHWLGIHQLRRAGLISPEEMRAEFVNLLRWRLQHSLGYRTTHALQIVNTSGQPIYTMVFATDSAPGERIMEHVYGHAATSTIPTMRARAHAARQRRREEAEGVMRLPGLEDSGEDLPHRGHGYDYVEPWNPPAVDSADAEFDNDVELDPDDIGPEDWDHLTDAES